MRPAALLALTVLLVPAIALADEPVAPPDDAVLLDADALVAVDASCHQLARLLSGVASRADGEQLRSAHLARAVDQLDDGLRAMAASHSVDPDRVRAAIERDRPALVAAGLGIVRAWVDVDEDRALERAAQLVATLDALHDAGPPDPRLDAARLELVRLAVLRDRLAEVRRWSAACETRCATAQARDDARRIRLGEGVDPLATFTGSARGEPGPTRSGGPRAAHDADADHEAALLTWRLGVGWHVGAGGSGLQAPVRRDLAGRLALGIAPSALGCVEVSGALDRWVLRPDGDDGDASLRRWRLGLLWCPAVVVERGEHFTFGVRFGIGFTVAQATLRQSGARDLRSVGPGVPVHVELPVRIGRMEVALRAATLAVPSDLTGFGGPVDVGLTLSLGGPGG